MQGRRASLCLGKGLYQLMQPKDHRRIGIADVPGRIGHREPPQFAAEEPQTQLIDFLKPGQAIIVYQKARHGPAGG